MQSFLISPDFVLSAKVLDNKRLSKQRIEAKQIYLALTNPSYGWQNHPAVRMWKGYEDALVQYGIAICEEWIGRGYDDSLLAWFINQRSINSAWPKWLKDERFFSSHRSNLLRKHPVWYGQFGWTESPDLPYFWPTKNGY